ncbi:MMPL family transporter [Streptomyces litmocidini]|uniref:MMPL family transporter n=1 Tax=Streptomyces litmocidini TaxID=67318 RepID=UPI0036F4E334
MFVPVIGTSTDHTLLPAARCPEGPVGQPDTARAVTAACRATAPPVQAGAATIACAMMTLTSSGLPAGRALRPAVTIATACCAAVSPTFSPAVPVLCGAGPCAPVPHGARAAGGRKPPGRSDSGPAGHDSAAWFCSPRELAALRCCRRPGPSPPALAAPAASVARHDVLARHFPVGIVDSLIVVAPASRAADVRDRIAAPQAWRPPRPLRPRGKA